MRLHNTTPIIALFLFIVACAAEETPPSPETTAATRGGAPIAANVPANPLRDAYFGNLHVHTRYSFDGYTNGSVTEPDDAYRWAKGEAIPGGGGGGELQILAPLDWYAVSDHSEYLGVFPLMEDPDSRLSQLPIAQQVTSDDQAVAFAAFAGILNDISSGNADPALSDPETSRSIWAEVVATADAHYQPGAFTTFAAYEWTSNPQQENLHRVVLFRDTANVPELPFSSFDSDRPEDLWEWMDSTRAQGTTLLAVPHNGNASNGLMFPEATSYGGSSLTREYAQARMRNEPVYEISQIKGTSETHPDLSPNDEFGGFELWDYTLSADARRPTRRVGSYVRDAYRRGLLLEAQGIGNPFKYGVIGDSDTHNSASAIEESNYSGKFAMENDPAHRLEGPPGFAEANARQLREFSSGGLAGVWAESNTREAIFDAIQRKETFGTSGTRLRMRFFGGYGFEEGMIEADSWLERAYAEGVPMGGDLPVGTGGNAPTFLIYAMKEANGANLDRIQVVKGWVDGDQTFERIYNVAWSGDRQADADGNVPAVGNTVDAATATYSNDIGAAELSAVWTDPDFDPAQHAFYYVRVLEIPTPRWSTYDTLRLGIPPRDDLPVSIQERGWSSPIWYTPGS